MKTLILGKVKMWAGKAGRLFSFHSEMTPPTPADNVGASSSILPLANTTWPPPRRPQWERDVKTCTLCGKLCSGRQYPKVFICDNCLGQMLPETADWIAEHWG